MLRTFTVIDSFQISEALRERGAELSVGTWFVLDGGFQSIEELPRPGATVSIVSPEGRSIHASVAHAEVRHGSGAVSFVQSLEKLPRLSTLSIVANGL